MLRRDTSALFIRVESGFWRWKRFTYAFFCSASGNYFVADSPDVNKTPEEYASILLKQQDTPVMIVEGGNRRKWWMFKDNFYWEDEGYTALEVKALLLKRMRDKEKGLKRAKTLMEQEKVILSARREKIPDDIKIFVWRRDEGKCVKCGSKESLEFDHIIPLSKGGSNTARNIQLLCEKCNREKWDAIA